MSRETVFLQHARIRLALHPLSSGEGPALLLLHELGGRSHEALPEDLRTWPGSVWALDFTGHGDSGRPVGGGYSAEILMADADVALAHIGEATVVGRGLGGYVALLLSGARPELVRGAVILCGEGLSGGGPEPRSDGLAEPESQNRGASGPAVDPFAITTFSSDIRPPGYVTLFVRQAVHLSGLERPITVSRDIPRPLPDWLEAILAESGVEEATLAKALERYSALARAGRGHNSGSA